MSKFQTKVDDLIKKELDALKEAKKKKEKAEQIHKDETSHKLIKEEEDTRASSSLEEAKAIYNRSQKSIQENQRLNESKDLSVEDAKKIHKGETRQAKINRLLKEQEETDALKYLEEAKAIFERAQNRARKNRRINEGKDLSEDDAKKIHEGETRQAKINRLLKEQEASSINKELSIEDAKEIHEGETRQAKINKVLEKEKQKKN